MGFPSVAHRMGPTLRTLHLGGPSTPAGSQRGRRGRRRRRPCLQVPSGSGEQPASGTPGPGAGPGRNDIVPWTGRASATAHAVMGWSVASGLLGSIAGSLAPVVSDVIGAVTRSLNSLAGSSRPPGPARSTSPTPPLLGISGVLAAAAAVQTILRLRAEEAEGRDELLPAIPKPAPDGMQRTWSSDLSRSNCCLGGWNLSLGWSCPVRRRKPPTRSPRRRGPPTSRPHSSSSRRRLFLSRRHPGPAFPWLGGFLLSVWSWASSENSFAFSCGCWT